jgi:carboxylesterase
VTSTKPPALLPGAEPYHGGDGPTGVLVLHGFTGSPHSMRPWAEHLAAAGFRVACPRLPGHGTTWQEMNQTRWEDWYAAADRELELLRAATDQVFLAGLSMGGGLALLLAARHGAEVAGVAAVNPSVDSRDPRMLLLPVLRHVVPSLGAISGDVAMPDVLEGAYERTPLHAAWSLTKLWQEIQRELPRVDQPLLIYRSRVDHTVGPSSLRLIQERVASRDVTVVMLERSYHVATLDYDAGLIFDGSTEFFLRLASKAR